MSTSIVLQGLREPWQSKRVKPFSAPLWQAWAPKGRTQNRWIDSAHVVAVKWGAIAGLLAVTEPWSHVAPYGVAVRCVLASSALIGTLQAWNTRHYLFAVVFGMLVLLYNPVKPMLSFSGTWQRALVALSVIPFIASLDWANAQEEQHE